MYNYYKIPCKLTGNGIMFPIISETHIFSHLKISEFIKIPFAFCDDCEDDEVMFGIIHLIEQLEMDGYLK